MAEKISKREFLKQCIVYGGGSMLGLQALDAHAFKNSQGIVPIDLWKWNKKAHYFTRTDAGPQCGLCPNACIVPKGVKSRCRTRVSFEGDLYSVTYGNPCSVSVDPVEKKPLNHFLPGSKSFSIATAGCNFSCLNCQNWQISQSSPFETENYDLMPEATIASAQKNNAPCIAFTYSEPVVFYEYMYDVSKLAKAKNIKTILVSNGYLNDKPLRDLAPYMDAANINLKAYDDEIYRKLNGGRLQTVLNTLKVLKQEGVWLEITNLVIPQWTDDMDMIARMCDWLVDNGFSEHPLHFSRFFPMYKLTSLPSTPETTLNSARAIALKAGLKYVYIGNIAGSEAQNTYCPKCSKLLIERRGHTVYQNLIKNGNCGYCGAPIKGVWQ